MQKVWVVNAFTNKIKQGNPAGVVIFDEWPTDCFLQEIASKLNFSNTAFVLNKKGTYHIRWFTPHSEAPLCGHATIAATKVLIDENLGLSNNEIHFYSKSGALSCGYENDLYTLNFPKYKVKKIDFTPEFLNLNLPKPSFFGIAENCLLASFKNAEDIINSKPNLEYLTKLPYRALIVTSPSHLNSFDFNSRYFAPSVGIDEDPVCASAHCRLIPYWAEKLNKNNLKAFQASERTGILLCKNLEDRVLISGEAVTVFKGDLNFNQLKDLKDVA